MAQRNWASAGKMYSGHIQPVMIDCNFVVASSDSGGLGITNLKGPYVQNVFMHTSATPGKGNSNPASPNLSVTNPNPASGTIIVQLQDSYNRLYNHGFSLRSPNGSNLAVDASDAALTVGVAYTITILGDATAADWLALGVPAGITPAVGVSFIAKVTGHGTASVSRVAPSAAAGSGIFSIEMVGDPNTTIAPNPATLQGFGSQFILQCRNDSASDAPQIATPADGTVIRLTLLLSNSSILIAGE